MLDGVDSTITDFGTSNHTPEDYLDHLVGFALYTTDDLPPGEVRLVPPDGVRRHRRRGALGAVRQHYRNIAAMDRDEKIRAGAYVYFTFLRPFAEVAGIADELDWTRAPGPPGAGLPAHVGDAGRERRRRRGRGPYYEPLPRGGLMADDDQDGPWVTDWDEIDGIVDEEEWDDVPDRPRRAAPLAADRVDDGGGGDGGDGGYDDYDDDDGRRRRGVVLALLAWSWCWAASSRPRSW